MDVTATRRRVLAGMGGALATGLAGCSFSTGYPTGLTALSTDDGSELWTAEVGSFQGDPLLAGGTVYVSADETLTALDPTNGSERWSVSLEDVGLADLYPTVAGDTVLTNAGESVVALSAADGSEQWRFDTGDEEAWRAPPVADGTVVVGAGEGRVHGVSLADGTEQWRFEGSDLRTHSAAVADGSAFVYSKAGGGQTHAISATDGSERWSYGTGKAPDGRPAVGADTVFVGTEARKMHAVSAADGSGLWDLDTSGRNSSTGHPELSFADGWVYAVDNTGLTGVDVANRDAWSNDVGGSFTLTPAGDSLFLGVSRSTTDANGQRDRFGTVESLARDGGDERWSVTVDSKVEMPPGVDGDAVYVGTGGGTVLSLSRDGGTERWSYDAGGGAGSMPPLVTDEAVVLGIE